MGLRFQRRIKILPGVTLNLSKSGVTTSIGKTGARVTLGRGQTRTTVGLPGTGLRYTSVKSNPRGAPALAPAAPRRAGLGFGALLLIGILALFVFVFLAVAVDYDVTAGYVLAAIFAAPIVLIVARHNRRARLAAAVPVNQASVEELARLQELFKPALAKTPGVCYEWPKNSGREVDVVGVSFYQANLARIVGPLNGPDAVDKDVEAALIPYRHPKFGAAVAVVVDGAMIGHIDKDDAGAFRAGLRRLKRTGQVTTCAAAVGGRVLPQEGAPGYWARLDIDFEGGADA